MRWLWGILLAGCGRFGFDAGPDAQGTDAPIAPPPGCVGADEDRDGWPDACDNCVTVANPTQADVGELDAGATEDGVGDACDPRPTIGGDRVAFATLHDGDALAAYDASYGIVAVPGNGALRLGALDDKGSAVFLYSGGVTRIDCAYTVVASSNQLQWFGVWTDDAASQALFLEGAWDTGFTNGVFRLKENAFPAADRYSTDILGPARFTPGATFHLLSDTELVTGAEQRLTITDRSTGISATTSLAIQIPRFGKGYLEANNVIVDFEYLVIYGVQ